MKINTYMIQDIKIIQTGDEVQTFAIYRPDEDPQIVWDWRPRVGVVVDTFYRQVKKTRQLLLVMKKKNTEGTVSTWTSPAYSAYEMSVDILEIQNQTQAKIFQLAQIVAGEFGVPVENILSKRRNKDTHAIPRQCFVFLAKKHIPSATYKQIGSVLPVHHSSMIHARQRWTDILDTHESTPSLYGVEAEATKRASKLFLEILRESASFVEPDASMSYHELIEQYDTMFGSLPEICLYGSDDSVKRAERVIMKYEHRIREIQAA